jgi:cell division protein ZapA (FtsZ GTPase activity inhibitor)
MDNLIAINLLIADRTYRVKVNKHEEEKVRRICKTANDKILEFKTQFAAKDMQDLIAMALLWMATNTETNQLNDNLANAQYLKDTADKLDRILNKIMPNPNN